VSTTLQDRLYRDAALYAPLTALLGTNPFRWYEPPLRQNSTLPAVTVQQVSGNETYGVSRRIKQGDTRMSFVIWGGQYAAGVAARDAVAAALVDFMDQWDGGIGITGLSQYPNRNVLNRETQYQWTDTPIYQRIMDFMITSDSTL